MGLNYLVFLGKDGEILLGLSSSRLILWSWSHIHDFTWPFATGRYSLQGKRVATKPLYFHIL